MLGIFRQYAGTDRGFETMAKLPRVPEGSNIWERQEWDTDASYYSFLTYYFNQAPPRSINQAWRDANPPKARGVTPDARNAPSNWRRWAAGQDTRGRRKFYELVKDDGTVAVERVPTWQDRVAAYEAYTLQQAITQEQAQIRAMRKQALDIAEIGLQKLKDAWDKYNPKGEEDLRALAFATDKLTGDLQRIDPDIFTSDDDEGKEGGTQITDMQRIDEIAKILAKSRQAKQGQESGNKKKQ